MRKQQLFTILLVASFFTSTSHLIGQSQCKNIGFEYGSLEGFEIYWGYTDDILQNSPLTPGTTNDQHVIQRRIDGFDPLSAALCNQNFELPLVGQGLGEYSLRLGNEPGGKRVARVVRELDVTTENNFLILSYAVFLEDPAHAPVEQPRFIFKIKDINDNVLTCGEYDVFAGPSIVGFENCDDWRVRPWTSAGFELQSFLGQRVRLEITTIDCDLGAHGGYAYMDLTCRPLEIVLSNYCEGESVAYLTVTEGFDRYLWNTGHTTNSIVINDPVPGAQYTVQVTSATGCTISLTDTLPYFEELPHAKLEQAEDVILCESSNFLFYPKGENIARLELVGSGFLSDSILINTLTDRTYTFVAADDFGCNSDTMSFTVFVKQPPFVTGVPVENVGCDKPFGSATVLTASNSTNQYTLDGITFQDSSTFVNLPPDDYFGNVINEYGCVSEFNFTIREFYSYPALSTLDATPPTCDLDNGSVELYGTDGQAPYLYSSDNETFGPQRVFNDLADGTHMFYVKDDWGCIDSFPVTLMATPPVEMDLVDQMDQNCEQPNGFITVDAEQGVAPYTYSWENVTNNDGVFSDLAEGNYFIEVTDGDGCKDTVETALGAIPIVEIIDVNIIDDKCSLNKGEVAFNVRGGQGAYTYMLDGVPMPDGGPYVGLPTGDHQLVVQDELGCVTTYDFNVGNVEGPTLDVGDVVRPHCGENNGEITVNYFSGTEPMTFTINGQPNSGPYFDNLAEDVYTIIIEDVNGCIDEQRVPLELIPTPRISNEEDELDECNEYLTTIEMDVDRGSPPYTLSYQGEKIVFDSEASITLPPGEHEITITDDFDCIVETGYIFEDVVSFYIPNVVLLGNNDGNDKFAIFKNPLANVKLTFLTIYDRWGSPVYHVEDMPLDENAVFWKGKFNGVESPPGNYVYHLEVSDGCKQIATERGSVLLIK